MKFNVNEESSDKTNKQWNLFLNKFKAEDLYVGGVFGLHYSLNFHDFINKQVTNDFVSVLFICNSLGIDKRELLISGKHNVFDVGNKSLPLDYCLNNSSQLNRDAIENYLRKLDDDLKSQKKSISLVLNIPEDYLNGLKFNHINIIYPESFDVVKKSIDKLVNCMKNSYRKLQITKNILHAKNSGPYNLPEYLYLLTMAWNNISNDYISRLFHFHEATLNWDDLYSSKHSLLYWCRMHNTPIDINLYGSFEDYIAFDKTIQVLSLTETANSYNSPKKKLHCTSESVSGMQAYQAMKRLVSFLHSKNADQSVIKSGKCLENHLEYKALLEIHDYVKGENEQS